MTRCKRVFILVAGMPGAGKGVFSEAARLEGLRVYTMGDVVREEVRRRGLPPTPENLNKVATELRRLYGPRVVAERTLERIAADGVCGCIVVDGVRSLDEVEVFKSAGEAVIVAIHASPRTRFERLRSRGRPGDPKSWEEFHARDLTELGFGVGSVIALADYMLVNEGKSVEDFRSEARSLIRELIRAYSCG